MALLSDTDRQRTAYAWARSQTEPVAFTRSQLKLAVDATDQWVEDNQTSFNTALPVGFRTNATTTQKIILLAYVLWRRIGQLKTTEDN
jgi:hypothetical protein